MTAHRAENVDWADRFADILEGIDRGASTFDVEAVYPIHPRAEEKLEEFGLAIPDDVRLIEPQAYLDFLALGRNAMLVMTDSGGVQEEACILQDLCVTMRDGTERPETVDVGANVVVGMDSDEIATGAVDILE